MYRVHLNLKQIASLQELPETGMGYQVADLTLRNGKVMKGIMILNSSFIDFPDRQDIVKIEVKNERSK